MATRTYSHKRPMNLDFYADIRMAFADKALTGPVYDVPQGRGLLVEAPAGSLICFELPEAAQIVNVFFWNSHDPDERYWAEETMLVDGAYLQRYTRMWGTMARFRPLATVIEDSVATLRRTGEPRAFHHFAHGGSGTPADWAIKGGRPGVASSWERLTSAMQSAAVPAHYLTENVSLFQKTAIDPVAQGLTILPSDALPGDRHVWFAEIDLTLAVAASPYRGGGIALRELDGGTAPVRVQVQKDVAEPLGWPYPGMAYPDLALYLDPATGARSAAVGSTPGIGDPS
jgi:uncharacterized protein YcgI (DUF1989 family)